MPPQDFFWKLFWAKFLARGVLQSWLRQWSERPCNFKTHGLFERGMKDTKITWNRCEHKNRCRHFGQFLESRHSIKVIHLGLHIDDVISSTSRSICDAPSCKSCCCTPAKPSHLSTVTDNLALARAAAASSATGPHSTGSLGYSQPRCQLPASFAWPNEQQNSEPSPITFNEDDQMVRLCRSSHGQNDLLWMQSAKRLLNLRC